MRVDVCVRADQWNVQLGDTLENSPFFETLSGAKETLVMLDRNADILYRLWVRDSSVRGSVNAERVIYM